jgi:hypothetical protein
MNGIPAEPAELQTKLFQSDTGRVAIGTDAGVVSDGSADGVADGWLDRAVAGFEPLAPALCEAPTEPGLEASRTPMTTAITTTARRVAAMLACRPNRVRCRI